MTQMKLEKQESESTESMSSSILHEYTMESILEEAGFVLYYLLKDATDIRLLVRRTRCLFKSNDVTLETAAVTMNVDISVIENMNCVLVKTFPDFPQLKKHYDALIFHWGQRWAPGVVKVLGGGPEFYAAYKDGIRELGFSDMVCSYVAYLIEQFLLHQICAGIFPRLETFEVPLTATEVAFWETTVQLSVLCLTGIEDLPQDVVLKTVFSIVKHQQCPTWAVFALQCIRDVHFELVGSVGDGLQGLEASTTAMLLSMPRYLAWNLSFRISA